MILEDFLADGETQTDPILFPIAGERLKKPSADGFRHSWSVVHDADLHHVLGFAEVDLDLPRFWRHRFTGIQQQVRKHPLHFLLAKPGFAPAFSQERNMQAVT